MHIITKLILWMLLFFPFMHRLLISSFHLSCVFSCSPAVVSTFSVNEAISSTVNVTTLLQLMRIQPGYNEPASGRAFLWKNNKHVVLTLLCRCERCVPIKDASRYMSVDLCHWVCLDRWMDGWTKPHGKCLRLSIMQHV